MRRKLFSAAVLGLAVWAFPGTANAALTLCPASFTTNPTAKVEDATGTFTAASQCQYITPADNSTVANVATVNANAFFGVSTWETFAGAALQTDANSGTGTWSIPNADFANYNYMLTFKDGADTNLISFLLNEVYSSGVWTTPFTDPPFSFGGASTSHNVSHFSLFRTPTGPTPNNIPETPVPEPASLLLLGSGLAVAGHRLRRRFQA